MKIKELLDSAVDYRNNAEAAFAGGQFEAGSGFALMSQTDAAIGRMLLAASQLRSFRRSVGLQERGIVVSESFRTQADVGPAAGPAIIGLIRGASEALLALPAGHPAKAQLERALAAIDAIAESQGLEVSR